MKKDLNQQVELKMLSGIMQTAIQPAISKLEAWKDRLTSNTEIKHW